MSLASLALCVLPADDDEVDMLEQEEEEMEEEMDRNIVMVSHEPGGFGLARLCANSSA